MVWALAGLLQKSGAPWSSSISLSRFSPEAKSKTLLELLEAGFELVHARGEVLHRGHGGADCRASPADGKRAPRDPRVPGLAARRSAQSGRRARARRRKKADLPGAPAGASAPSRGGRSAEEAGRVALLDQGANQPGAEGPKTMRPEVPRTAGRHPHAALIGAAHAGTEGRSRAAGRVFPRRPPTSPAQCPAAPGTRPGSSASSRSRMPVDSTSFEIAARSLGTSALTTSQPVSVTTTTSSMRTPMPLSRS